MRVVVLCVLVSAAVACGGTSALFTEYEYEEEMYLTLDGSATIYVNSSIQALNALRGTSFDERPNVRIDRDAIRQYFSTPTTRVIRVSSSRRGGRQYVHVRLEADDVRRLSSARPFDWSDYRLGQEGEVVVYKQTVAAPAVVAPDRPAVKKPDWAGDELTAFRIHIPSVVEYHNAGAGNLRRGNILVWEQPLAERLTGTPVELEVRMQPQSILYRTLILFAAMFAAVAMVFAAVIWRVVRAGQNS